MIITHSGQAHRDDFLSCCLLLSKYGGTIERRNPTQEELNNPDIFVVDVGEQYKPELRNFDHHQFDRNHDPVCALTLVMKYMGLDYSILPWFSTTEFLDSKGPFQFCTKVGISPDTLEILQSPVEGHILRLFSEYTSGIETSLTYIMRLIGTSMIEYIEKVSTRIKQLEKCPTWEIGTIPILVLDACISKEDPVLGVEIFCKRLNPQPNVTITYDDRGPGYCLYRRNDDPRVDFSQIEGLPGVVFAHKNGFIAKTEKNVDLFNLIEESLVR